MKIITLSIYFLFIFSGLKAQTIAVTNVVQDGQNLVVSYDITGGAGTYDITLFCSTDNGITWAGPLKSVSGDVGRNIIASENKTITWVVLNDRLILKSNKIRFKVQAKSIVNDNSVKEIKNEFNETILSIGNKNVSFGEFKYVYNMNESKKADAYTENSIREYVDLYINFKLKVIDAEKMRLDTTTSFKKELDDYQKQLAKPYLTDRSVTQKLVTEAYNRMKEEVNASHILIKCDAKADPKDTLAAYNKIMDIRKKILAGESFEKMAKDKSEDPSAKYNDGNLGFFTAMQMVYPFEDVAYKTAKGAISNPVRTQFGYHIIKVQDRRPSQGQITVAHIMVRATPGMPVEDSLMARKKIYDIYYRLKEGENFESLAMEFSDHADSKTKGGILPAFGTGTMVPSFENAAFALKDTDNISEPFQTPFGWHIVKLKNRKLLEPFDELKSTLETKVSKDSRSELNRPALLSRLRKENGMVENKALMAYAFSKSDTSLASGKWKYDMADKKLDEIILTIKEKKYTLRDFWKAAEKKQQANKSKALDYQMKLLFKDFEDEAILDYEESHLTEKYEDYRMLVKEYRDGILLFNIMDRNVWTKALEDSDGRKAYFYSNIGKYSNKNFDPTDKLILSDYQNYLEFEWLNKLKANINVYINESLISKLIIK